jgi:DNA polymerase-3 subunit epsilon
MSRRLTQRRFHCYLNPERESDEGALKVHGLSTEFLADKPRFADIAAELVQFIHGAELIIHNAPFDVAFLDAEFARLNQPSVRQHCAGIVDSLLLAREQHPGKRNSLDALCERYSVSNAHRTMHGALLDAGLLAEVYLAMTRGQNSLEVDFLPAAAHTSAALDALDLSRLIVVAASPAEQAAHEQLLAGIARETQAPVVWRSAVAR